MTYAARRITTFTDGGNADCHTLLLPQIKLWTVGGHLEVLIICHGPLGSLTGALMKATSSPNHHVGNLLTRDLWPCFWSRS